jgi:transcription initiation factor TFIIIB Brf1 subunit/transcription initiation factor TFIIB
MTNKIIDIDLEFDGFELDEKSIKKYTAGKKASNSMKGKTLEQLIGKEKAIEGRKIRSKNSKGPRPDGVGKKIADARRANGSYGKSMLGKEHKESTKLQQSIKAQIRQDLKKKLKLGRNDIVPKELLTKAYKKAGLV